MVVLHLLHPFAEVYFILFCWRFHFEMNVILNWEAFVSTLVHSLHFFFDDPLGMVYELLWNCFISNNFVMVRPLFQGMWAHCSKSCSTFNIAFIFCILIFNVGESNLKVCPIMIGEMTCRLVAHILAIQFRDIIAEHFNCHQFGVTTHGGCETMVHDVWVMLNLHLD